MTVKIYLTLTFTKMSFFNRITKEDVMKEIKEDVMKDIKEDVMKEIKEDVMKEIKDLDVSN